MQQSGFCLRHNEFPVTTISFKNDKVQLLCEDCLLNLRDQNEKVDVGNLIFIRKVFYSNIQAIKQPQYLLSKLKLDCKFQQFFDILTRFDEREIEQEVLKFENELKKIQQTINLVIVEINEFRKTLIINRRQLQVDLLNIINYKQFQMTINELNQSDTNQKIIESIEQKIEVYLQDLKKSKTLSNDLDALLQKSKQQINNPQLRNLDNQTQELIEQIQQFYRNFNSNQEIAAIQQQARNIIVTQEYFAVLNNQIEVKTKKKILGVDLIYLGQGEGLNSKNFWNRVNGKENLLIVLKSKTNNIFGGYAPCKWDQYKGDFVADRSMASFLFSMTHQQIYNLKQKACQVAIYCASSYGPTFGGGYDIYINNDFKTGYSRLGHSYEWQNEEAQNTNTHLFGGEQPNIIECQVYEITLK